jgi:hypothetical protein
MKVALAFFGQPRFVDNPKVINTYKKVILDRYDTDVFCHTWWTEDGGEYDYSTWSKISKCPIPKDALEIIDKNYKPIVLEYDTPETFVLPPKAKSFIDAKFTGKHPHGNHWNEKNYSNVMSQLKSIQKVSNLVEEHTENTGTEYDFIVLARYDTSLIGFPDLNQCDSSKFYLPGHHPRFPDTIQFFGSRYLEWSKNAFDDIEYVYQGIWEPSPEAFKMGSFLRRFELSDLAPCSMDAACIRQKL